MFFALTGAKALDPDAPPVPQPHRSRLLQPWKEHDFEGNCGTRVSSFKYLDISKPPISSRFLGNRLMRPVHLLHGPVL